MRKLIYILVLLGSFGCTKAQYFPGKIIPRGQLSFNNTIFGFDGNSLTYGYLASSSAMAYPKQLEGLLTGYTGFTTTNFGVTAQTTEDMADDAESEVDAIIDDGKTNILFAWEIGNDIFYNGSVANAQTRFRDYCLSRRAAGWDYIIVITVPPRNQSTSYGDNSAQYNLKLSQANTWLRANYRSFADALVDPAADSRMTNTGNATYFNADEVHYTDAGYGVIAELARAALSIL